jgi:hypothetical protein
MGVEVVVVGWGGECGGRRLGVEGRDAYLSSSNSMKAYAGGRRGALMSILLIRPYCMKKVWEWV